MVASVFIDGQAGRTGLRIRDLLRVRRDLDVLEIDNQQRKDPAARCSNAPMSRCCACPPMLREKRWPYAPIWTRASSTPVPPTAAMQNLNLMLGLPEGEGLLA